MRNNSCLMSVRGAWMKYSSDRKWKVKQELSEFGIEKEKIPLRAAAEQSANMFSDKACLYGGEDWILVNK